MTMASSDELARHLDLPRQEIDRLVSAGILPAPPAGKHDPDTARRAYITHLRETAVRAACRRYGVEGELDDLLESMRIE